MWQPILEILRDPETWKYASIPVVAAVVGWATNWVAIQLTFYPLEFFGLWKPWVGWQGIIPSKAGKMAATFHDSTMSRLGRLEEVFEHMEPERISRQITKVLLPRMDDYTDEVMLETQGRLWENTPRLLRRQVYARVREELPALVDNLMAEVGQDIEDLIDFKHMLVSRLTSDKALLNRLFLECGDAEFRFIVRSGFYFGGLFGLVQLAVWILYPATWVLPVFGLLVGYATNWIALNLIFRPLHPVKLGPWTLQGLFLKRQKEVAGIWCAIVTREILTLRNLIDAMLNGPRSVRTRELVSRHIRPLVDETAGLARTAAELAVGSRGFERIRASVGRKAIDLSMVPFNDWIFNRERAVVVERLLRERMEALPSEEFQDLLRPCFQEDEMKLILLGAALGLAAGTAQLFLVFGGAQ